MPFIAIKIGTVTSVVWMLNDNLYDIQGITVLNLTNIDLIDLVRTTSAKPGEGGNPWHYRGKESC